MASEEKACKIGKHGDCAWGVRNVEANYCLWRFVTLYPGENQVGFVADSLGISTERVRHYLQRSIGVIEGLGHAHFGYGTNEET